MRVHVRNQELCTPGISGLVTIFKRRERIQSRRSATTKLRKEKRDRSRIILLRLESARQGDRERCWAGAISYSWEERRVKAFGPPLRDRAQTTEAAEVATG